jgi:hypothetical protein
LQVPSKTKKKRAPKPPEPRGRRGHRQIDEKPELRALIVEWLKEDPRPTYAEMHERALETGYAIGRTAIWQWVIDFEIKQAERDLAMEMARQYNASAPDGEVLDIETAIAMIANVEIYRDLSERVGQGIDGKTADLLKTFYRLQSSSSQRERAKFYVSRGVKRAMVGLIGRLSETLKKHPEQLRIVVNELRNAVREMAE